MRGSFDRREDPLERSDVSCRKIRQSRSFELREVLEHTTCDEAAPRCRPNDEGAAVGGAGLARHQASPAEAVEDTGESGAVVREGAMQIADRHRAVRKVRKDVRLALRQAVAAAVGDVQSDAVRGPMDRGNQPKRHRGQSVRRSGAIHARRASSLNSRSRE